MTRTTFKKVPFDIELAKKITNKEVKGRIVTEDGLTARIVCFDYNFGGKKDNIVVIIEHTEYEGVLTCFADGLYHSDFFLKNYFMFSFRICQKFFFRLYILLKRFFYLFIEQQVVLIAVEKIAVERY